MNTNRITPVPLPLDTDLQSTMDKIFPAFLPSPTLYRIIAKNQPLFEELVVSKFIGQTGLFDRRRLSPILREKIILRTCFATNNQYEFALHEETISEKMGLSKVQISDLKNPVLNPEIWEEEDLILFQLIDNLVKYIPISDDFFTKISVFYKEDEMIDIIFIVGLYTSVAMFVAFANPIFDNYKQFQK